MNDTLSSRLIGAAVAMLRTEVLPQVADPISRIKIDHVTRMLWGAAARLDTREPALRTLLADLGVQDDKEDPEAARLAAEAAIGAELPVMLASAGDTAGYGRLRALVDAEKRFFLAQDPDIAGGSGVVYRGGRIEGPRAEPAPSPHKVINADGLTAYLRRRFGGPALSVTDVRHIPGGFSKGTIFFTRIDGQGRAEKLVIRKDLLIPLVGATVVNEFPRLEHLYALGFPVPEPLWLEADPTVFDGAFIVSRRAPGTSDAATWSADPERARAACRELACVMARLHGYTPEQLGVPAADAALSAGAWVERETDRWIKLFHERREEPYPLQEMPLLWLRGNIPATLYERPVRVIHGDIGFHNLMFDEAGKVSAVLDWEFSCLGDPTQDLCFARQFVEQLMPWEEFLSIYRAAGGAGPCDEAGFWYDLWTSTRNAVGSVDCQRLFDTSMPEETRFALAGHIFAPYMFIDQCEMLLGHLAARLPGVAQ